MPSDQAWVMRRARAVSDAERESVRAVLAEFFTVEDGRYSNARLRREWLAANEAHERRKNAGSIGGKTKALKTKKKTSSNAVAMPKQPEPEPEPYIKRDTNVSLALSAPECVPDPFEEFWDQYPHRGGAKKGKAVARKSWNREIKAKVSPQAIIAGAMRYGGDRNVLNEYAKDPATWLNQKGWEDDVEQSDGHNSAGNGSNAGSNRPGAAMAQAFANVAGRHSAVRDWDDPQVG